MSAVGYWFATVFSRWYARKTKPRFHHIFHSALADLCSVKLALEPFHVGLGIMDSSRVKGVPAGNYQLHSMSLART